MYVFGVVPRKQMTLASTVIKNLGFVVGARRDGLLLFMVNFVRSKTQHKP